MKFKINSKIFESYPELKIGVITAKNVDNSKHEKTLLCEEEDKWRAKNLEIEEIAQIPTITKWREIYKSFRAKPGKFRNSAEAILRSALTRGLPSINCLVDLYNYISLKYTMTVGGEDIDKIEGDLVLGYANGNEEFIGIGSDKNEPPMKGEILYKDHKGVICRCWNWREGDRTKLTKDTKNVIIVIENILPEKAKELIKAIEELKNSIKKDCGGEVKSVILDKDNQEVNIK